MRPLEPVDWNRAEGDEAEEEDVVEIPAPIFNPSDVPTTSCNGLFVAPYGAGSAFLEAQLPRLTTKAAGSLVLPKVPGSLGNNKDSTCRLYLDTNNNNLYAVCHDSEIDIHRAYAWTEALFKHIQPKFVVIFESLKYSQYKGDSIDITPPLLRVLQTDKQKTEGPSYLNKLCPYLETPNIVSGVAAAVLTHCQVHFMPASLYVSLEDPHALEVETVQAFEAVLNAYNTNNNTNKLTAKQYRPYLEKYNRKRANQQLYL
eukprot:GEZU01025375.1.p1 GENE.GEZU01025375.1~~GEZU01025375.1.p1  ORF type:complete len:258 (-),score=37.98 GEZU01025375.1:45-818(-)